MSVQIPKRIGFAGAKLRLLEKTLQEIVDAIDAVDIPDASDVSIEDAGDRFSAEDVEAALQEIAGAGRSAETVKGAADAAAAAVAAAATAVKGESVIGNVRVGRITLNGVNPTKANFVSNQGAFYEGQTPEPFDFSDGNLVLRVNPDGEGNEDITFAAVAGKHDGGEDPVIDLQGTLDNKFLIAVDGDVGDSNWQEVEFDVSNCDNGANTAAELQTKIQALGDQYAAVTVSFETTPDFYRITSGTKGQGSKVRIERATSNNATEELKLGPDSGNGDEDGSGVGQNSAEATAAEVAAFINEEATNFTAGEAPMAGYVSLYGTASGGSIVIGANDPSTANAVLGFTENETVIGAVGLGYATPMANDEYYVAATPVGINKAGKAAIKLLSINNKSAAEFEVVSADDASTFEVDLMIFGDIDS